MADCCEIGDRVEDTSNDVVSNGDQEGTRRVTSNDVKDGGQEDGSPARTAQHTDDVVVNDNIGFGFLTTEPDWIDTLTGPYPGWREQRPKISSDKLKAIRLSRLAAAAAEEAKSSSTTEGTPSPKRSCNTLHPSEGNLTIVGESVPDEKESKLAAERAMHVRNRPKGRLVDLHPLEVQEILEMRESKKKKKLCLKEEIGRFINQKDDGIG